MFDTHKTPSIIVVGDLMIDHYLWGKCDRISPEAPVQVINVENETQTLGGACNVMNNLKALGCHVYACGVVGRDDNGKKIIGMLQELAIKTEGIVYEDSRKTTKKSRVIASHQQVVRVDRENSDPIRDGSCAEIIKYLATHIHTFDVVLLSDYGKGVLREGLTQEIISLAKRHNKKVLVDPKGKDYGKYNGAYLITPNRKEASLATGIDITDEESLLKAGNKLKSECELDVAVITLSEDGMAIFGDEMHKIPTVAREVYDVTGAGDTVLASIGFGLAYGKDIIETCKFANAAAAVVVGKIGSATATLHEIFEYQHSLHKTRSEEKIVNLKDLKQILKNLKLQNKKIVFTNGCFDILHRGHVEYLEEAKSFGDILVLGLNSDASVKRLKGDSRPINTAIDRATVLAALESVDFVVMFTEDTPYELIKAVVPDVLVKGGDYRDKEVVGSDIATEVKLVDFVDGKSTTNIIEKICKV